MRQLRRRYDLSQRQLATLSGLAPSTIGDLESGRTVPQVATLEAALAGVGFRLELIDPGGRVMQWAHLDDDHPRDAAGRRYPAHLDVRRRYPFVSGQECSILWRGSALTYHVCRTRRDAARLAGHFGLWGAGPPTPGCFDAEYARSLLPDDGRDIVAMVAAQENRGLAVVLPPGGWGAVAAEVHLSQRSQSVPNGGSRRWADAGKPCQPSPVASTPPRLPTPEPP